LTLETEIKTAKGKETKMKSLIVYSSKTGNTRKLAEIANEMLAGDKTFCPVSEAPDPTGFDLVVVGFWLQAGKPDPKSAEYLAKIGDAKLFLLATHGAAADSPHAQTALETARSLAAEAQVVGSFNCPGEVNPAVLEKASQKDPQPPWLADAPAAVGRPNAEDLAALRAALRERLSDFLS
jgi:flavodoxin